MALPSVTESDRLEIRLSPVLTGGVSLAVWQGGVTAEIHRLRAGLGAYGELLELLGATVAVDVIAGTSAGGLNGALLAAAVSAGSTPEAFLDLRRVWVDDASFEALLRDPVDAAPPSLLRGEEYFLPRIEQALERLAPTGAAGGPGADVDVLLTATALDGRPVSHRDDFGQVLSEVDHRALFRFRSADLADRAGRARLARAARTTASFPAAFEPSFLAVGGGGDGDLSGLVDLPGSRWAMDGGVLRNAPIGPAIDAIFARSSEREVRRAVLYVNPDPGHLDDPVPARSDARPDVVEVVWSALVALPRVQSVAGDLDELRAHNQSVRVQRRVREGLLADGETDAVEQARTLYGTYAARRLQDSVTSSSARIVERARVLGLDGVDWERVDRAVAASAAWLPTGFPDRDDLPPTTPAWRFGISSLEYGTSTVIDLVARLHRSTPLHDRAGERRAIADLRRRVHLVRAGLEQVRTLDSTYWDARLVLLAAGLGDLDERRPDGSVGRARPLPAGGRFDGPPVEVPAVAADAPPTIDALVAWFSADAYNHWPGLRADEQDVLARVDPDRLTAWERAAAAALGPGAEVAEAAVQARLGTLAVDLGQIAADAAALAPATAGPDGVAADLAGLLAPFGGDAVDCLRVLLALHVTQVALDAAPHAREQPVALVQISADGTVGPDARTRPDEKLAGIQLGHFGAFYTESWRANDWMWGRLDAVSRLVRVCLDPARLVQRVRAETGAADPGAVRQATFEAIARLALAVDDDGQVLDPEAHPVLAAVWNERAGALWEELAFVTEGAIAPASLPVAADVVSRRIQLDVLGAELPEVAAAVRSSTERGADTSRSSGFAERVAGAGSPVPVADRFPLLDACRVGEERLTDQTRSQLFLGTATTSTRVGIGVVAASERLPWVRPVAGALHWLSRRSSGRVGRLVIRPFTWALRRMLARLVRRSSA